MDKTQSLNILLLHHIHPHPHPQALPRSRPPGFHYLIRATSSHASQGCRLLPRRQRLETKGQRPGDMHFWRAREPAWMHVQSFN